MFKLLQPCIFVLAAILSFVIAQNREGGDCLHECDDKPYGYKIPDPTDCLAYFLCHGDMIIQQYCSAGSKFNNEQQTCVVGKCPPCNCNDAIISTTTTTTSSPTPSPLTNPPPSTSTNPPPSPSTNPSPSPNPSPTPPTTQCAVGSLPPNCSTVENDHIFPDAAHCRFFWQCVSGRAVCRFCERGMWWDRDRYVCNYPSLVQNCPSQQD